ncbi:hypothetical protein BV898_03717 [Hypsibius exemplaris]|uniref:Gustatory receptor n=1 Tax=Hypsibius exemplaris TaxID=2072580 RepID=A0A1W0X3X7_HYPEX|nr:hypothetical protein BV898_03717 [Hypsibius exemplaris]
MLAEQEDDIELTMCQRLRQNPLFRVCMPFLLLMRIGGAFFMPVHAILKNPHQSLLEHDPQPLSCSLEAPPTTFKQKKIARVRTRMEKFELTSKVYCLFSFFWVLAYTGRYVWSLFYTLPNQLANFNSGRDLAHLLTKIANGVWFVNVLVVHVIFLRACSDKSKFFNLFMKWEKWRYISRNKNCTAFADRFLPRRNVVTAFAVIVLIPQLLSVWLPALYNGPELGTLKGILFDGFDPDNRMVVGITVIGHFFASFVYIVPVFLFALIGLAVEGEYLRLNHDLYLNLGADGVIAPGYIECFRQKHGKLCDFLELADSIFALFCLITIGAGVFEIFSLVFIVCAFGNDDTRGVAMTFAQIFWFMVYIMQPWVVLWTGVRVNDAAHLPLSKLYRIDQAKLPAQETLQLHSFIGRLTGSRLGFTAWRMFTIDATALLSLLGLYVTYQLLLFQVQIDLTSPDSPVALVGHRTDANVTYTLL